MRITQEADYALRIVTELACLGGIVDSKTIAEAVNVPERFTVKIMRKLVLNGIVKSHKGASGGYELSILPSEISIKRIVELIDGPFEITRCLDSDYECSKNGDNKKCCAYHCVFGKINRSISDKLDSITIDMILDDSLGIEDILAKI